MKPGNSYAYSIKEPIQMIYDIFGLLALINIGYYWCQCLSRIERWVFGRVVAGEGGGGGCQRTEGSKPVGRTIEGDRGVSQL